MKDKFAKTVLQDVNELVNESKLKSNKFGIYQKRECYNSPMQKWLRLVSGFCEVYKNFEV